MGRIWYFQTDKVIRQLRCLAAVVVGLYFAGNSLLMSWNQYLLVQDEQKLNKLNELASIYAESCGKKPDLHLIDLYRAGLTKSRIHPTPFGGFYRLNQESGVVYNPSRLLMGDELVRSTTPLSKITTQNR